MADTTVLVTGATGKVSTALLAALKGRPGIRLRAMVHNSAKAAALGEEGYEVAVGDLEEPDTLAEAFAGVDILFLVTPASALEPSMGSNAVAAARRAKVGHMVRNSAIKAAHDAPNFKDVTGQDPRSFAQFAADFAPAFGGSAVPAARA